MDAEQQLAEARAAWRDRIVAEAAVARLRTYSGMNRAMKADLSRWNSLIRQADATLAKILGGAK